MRQSEINRLKKLTYCSPIIGVLAGSIYLLIKHFSGWSFGFSQLGALTTIISTFSFTMLGFLAAIAAILFSLQKYRFFKRWVEDGHAEVFFALYKVTFLSLFLTFFTSLFIFTTQIQAFAFKIMMMSVFNNAIQLCLLTIIIMDKVFKAKEQP